MLNGAHKITPHVYAPFQYIFLLARFLGLESRSTWELIDDSGKEKGGLHPKISPWFLSYQSIGCNLLVLLKTGSFGS